MQDIHIVLKPLCILQLATGARIGEIMALTYDSLDFKKNTLTINKSWDYKSAHGFKPTKNKENRTIGVDAKTMALLKPYYDEVKKASLKSRFNNPNRLVFVSMNGDPITVDAVNKCLRHACTRAGIPTITSHGPEAYACIHPLAASSRSALRVGAPWPQVADHDCIHLCACPEGDEGKRRRTRSGDHGDSLRGCKIKCRTRCKNQCKKIYFLIFSCSFSKIKNK